MCAKIKQFEIKRLNKSLNECRISWVPGSSVEWAVEAESTEDDTNIEEVEDEAMADEANKQAYDDNVK